MEDGWGREGGKGRERERAAHVTEEGDEVALSVYTMRTSLSVCVCVCLFVWEANKLHKREPIEREREREKKSERRAAHLLLNGFPKQ